MYTRAEERSPHSYKLNGESALSLTVRGSRLSRLHVLEGSRYKRGELQVGDRPVCCTATKYIGTETQLCDVAFIIDC